MVRKRLQNKVAGSELTFPVCITAAVAMWWWPQQAVSALNLVGCLLCLLTAFVVMETNTRQHIIRIRTRMMSCVWLILSASLSFMHPLGEPLVAASFLCISYMLLFRCYGKHRPQLTVFHAFVMLGMGSFCTPVMLLMVIPYFFYIGFYLRALTPKAFWAGILGIIVPYWCFGVWYFATGEVEVFKARLTELVHFELPTGEAIASMPLAWQVSAAVVALLSIISIRHYLSTNFDDKIRVRMILYIYVSQTLLLMALLLLQPARYQTTMALLISSAAPLIAHYFALSKGIVNTIIFIISLLLMAGMATLNLSPSLSTLL